MGGRRKVIGEVLSRDHLQCRLSSSGEKVSRRVGPLPQTWRDRKEEKECAWSIISNRVLVLSENLMAKLAASGKYQRDHSIKLVLHWDQLCFSWELCP